MEKATIIEDRRASRTIADHELLGDKLNTSHEEAMHFGALTEEELVIEKKLRRKIDSLIMPTVVLVYLMNYIDRYGFAVLLIVYWLTPYRNNYAAARLQGLEEDLNLTGTQYQTGLSILFVGYIIAQVPSNMVLNYLGRPSLYLG